MQKAIHTEYIYLPQYISNILSLTIILNAAAYKNKKNKKNLNAATDGCHRRII